MQVEEPSGKGVINLKKIVGKVSIDSVEETGIDRTVHSKGQSGHGILLNLITAIVFLLVFPSSLFA